MFQRLTVSPVVAAILLWSIGCGLCANEVVSDVHSPDGKARAVVFRRDCGATTDFTLNVSILRATEPLTNEGGNVFRSESDGKVPPLEVKVIWRDSSHLLVSFPRRARVYRQYGTRGAIRIDYEKLAE